MSAILGLISTGTMFLWGRAFFAELGATGPALEAATLYSNVLFLGAVPFWLFNAAASVLRGGGNAMYPAAAGAAGGVVTLAASPLVIFGAGPIPALGLAGAAGAVVVYNVAMAATLLKAVWATGSPTRPGCRLLVPRRRHASAILRVAIPSAASTLLTNLTFIILTALVAPFGTEATAGYGAAGRLEYLLIPIVFGVGSALVPLVAASDGVGDVQRVRKLTRAGAALARGRADWSAALRRCSPRPGWGCSPRTQRSRHSAGPTWCGSDRPTRSWEWGWRFTLQPKGGGGQRSRSWQL